MFQHGILIIVRDDRFAAYVSRPMQSYTLVRRVRSCSEARPLLSSNALWSGIVLDLDGLDLDPLGATALVRDAHPLASVLVFASRVTAALVNDLYTARAELLLKPIADTNLLTFAQRALVGGWFPDSRVIAWVEVLARTRNLTAREVQLIAYALGGESREAVLRRLGISVNTLKTQVRSLLRKCAARSLDDLANRVLRNALIFESFAAREKCPASALEGCVPSLSLGRSSAEGASVDADQRAMSVEQAAVRAARL